LFAPSYNGRVTPAEHHPPSAASGGAGRRTNAERSATTRTKLLDAAVESLVELGYARTSTIEVARRAGVSRGAMLHHFPSKQSLLVAACDHSIERHADEVRAVVGAVPEGADRVDVVIDLLWGIMRGPTFAAPFELTAAARTDPELRPVVAAMGLRIDSVLQAASDELFPAHDDDRWAEVFPVVRRLTFAVLYGLALQSYTGTVEAEVHAAGVLELYKGLARLLDTAGRVPEVASILAPLMGATDPSTWPDISSELAAFDQIDQLDQPDQLDQEESP
jgi:AcrR family transcriptional regulator